MPLIDRNAEQLRKENLKKLEDKRVLFSEKLEKMNFKPERMIFCSGDDGGFVALARPDGKYAVITAPAFGSEDDFTIAIQDEMPCEREEIYQKGTGMNGIFGFGTKGAKGFNLTFTLEDGRTAVMPFVAGRNSWLEVTAARKNPLLKVKRRRGDANVVWDLMPIDPNTLPKIEATLEKFYL